MTQTLHVRRMHMRYRVGGDEPTATPPARRRARAGAGRAARIGARCERCSARGGGLRALFGVRQRACGWRRERSAVIAEWSAAIANAVASRGGGTASRRRPLPTRRGRRSSTWRSASLPRRLERFWAWRQLGLWQDGDPTDDVAAATEAAGRSSGRAGAIVAVLSEVARAGTLPACSGDRRGRLDRAWTRGARRVGSSPSVSPPSPGAARSAASVPRTRTPSRCGGARSRSSRSLRLACAFAGALSRAHDNLPDALAALARARVDRCRARCARSDSGRGRARAPGCDCGRARSHGFGSACVPGARGRRHRERRRSGDDARDAVAAGLACRRRRRRQRRRHDGGPRAAPHHAVRRPALPARRPRRTRAPGRRCRRRDPSQRDHSTGPSTASRWRSCPRSPTTPARSRSPDLHRARPRPTATRCRMTSAPHSARSPPCSPRASAHGSSARTRRRTNSSTSCAAGVARSSSTRAGSRSGCRLDEISVELRRAGLDLDPGWLPWLGAVVRFVVCLRARSRAARFGRHAEPPSRRRDGAHRGEACRSRRGGRAGRRRARRRRPLPPRRR